MAHFVGDEMKRKRKFASAEQARQSRELAASWEKLVKKHQPKQPPKASSGDEQYVVPLRPVSIRDVPPPGVSLNGGVDPTHVAKAAPKYEGTMLEREQAAKAQYERMKMRVAPPGNKMGAQYLSESECEAFRAGELRRR